MDIYFTKKNVWINHSVTIFKYITWYIYKHDGVKINTTVPNLLKKQSDFVWRPRLKVTIVLLWELTFYTMARSRLNLEEPDFFEVFWFHIQDHPAGLGMYL